MSFCGTSLHVCGLSNVLAVGTIVLVLRLNRLRLGDVSMVSDGMFLSSRSAKYGSVLFSSAFLSSVFLLV